MIFDFAKFDNEVLKQLITHGISPDTPVSIHSKFGDRCWYFKDSKNPRMAYVSDGELTLDWWPERADVSTDVPEATMQLLKIFAFLYLYAPATVGIKRKQLESANNPKTVVQALYYALLFFAHIHSKSELIGGTLPPAESPSEITAEHIRESLRDWELGTGAELRRVLTYLASDVIKKICHGFAPAWTAADIETMDFKPSVPRDRSNIVLPAPLFRLISNSATDDVTGFLRFIGEGTASGVPGVIPPPFDNLKSQGQLIFETYSECRSAHSAFLYEYSPAPYGQGKHAKSNVLKSCGCTLGDVWDYIRRVHEAACSVIGLYTGARYSDLTGFKIGCLQQIRGAWYLVGTHIKHESLDKPADNDIWPAIPAMRDALKCLELICSISGNQYLLSTPNTAFDGGQAYSSTGLSAALTRYVRTIDTSGTWANIPISTQRCRNTLAHQLARADLGLPYISYHLKHMHSALRSTIPQVTLTYGSIPEMVFEKALSRPMAQFELAKSLYHPDAPVAGGGAEQFKRDRKQYFEGKMAEGMTVDDILAEISKQQMPFSSVGMGYCLGKRDIKNKDGTVQKPPCIGSLQCAPDKCGNALITMSHVGVWKKVEFQNKELAARPDMQHAAEGLLSTAQRAHGILKNLGVV
ncbi:hypothetical protein J8I26_06590 [Herbaspirillum sp. LeCh32-8]|uniref:hypothetical protein n=1 Tax=Herbaspirillum sp. LeCh32-8 TaxID=2821356 RepID=UPI001AE807D7|nr:hypothetical protein [Herbaspirillum sp. LeCh32-8]MBP0597761.1 hypothetical protein [Herbaspirillum sp. LeCh32-8]